MTHEELSQIITALKKELNEMQLELEVAKAQLVTDAKLAESDMDEYRRLHDPGHLTSLLNRKELLEGMVHQGNHPFSPEYENGTLVRAIALLENYASRLGEL